jgi:hypothetical protein
MPQTNSHVCGSEDTRPHEIGVFHANRTRHPLRWLIIAASIIACLLLLALIPAVQRALLSLADQQLEAVSIQAGAVHVGPWGGYLEELSVTQSGFALQAKALHVDIAFWPSLFKRRLIIEKASGEHINLALSPTPASVSAPADTEAPPARPFNGLSPLLRWPRFLVVEQLTANGRVEVISQAPEGSAPTQFAGPWELQASALQAGEEAKLTADITLRASRNEQHTGGLIAHLQGNADIERTGAIETLKAEVQIIPAGPDKRQGSLIAATTLDLSELGEHGQVTLITKQGKSVAQLDAKYKPDDRTAQLDWQIDISPELVTAFLASGAHAQLQALSSGSADLAFEQKVMTIKGTVAAEGRGWDWFDPRLQHLEDLALNAELDARGWGARWTAETLRGQLHLAEDSEALSVELLQPVEIDMARFTLAATHWGEPALRIAAHQLPLAWLRGFDPQEVFESGYLDGSLVLTAQDHRFYDFVAEEPLRVTDLQLNQRSGKPLPHFAITVLPNMKLKEGALIAQVERLEIEADNGLRIDFRGQAGTSANSWPEVEFLGGVALRAPGLQRKVRQLDALRGMAEVKLDLVELRLAIERLALDATATDGDKLASLHLEGDSPLAISLASQAVDWDDFTPQRLTLKFMGTPIEWLSPFLPEIDLIAGEIHGELRAEAGAGQGFELLAPEPIEVRGIVPLYRGTRFARSLKLTLEPRVRLSNRGGTAALDNIQLHSRNNDRLGGHINFSWTTNPPKKLAMKLAIEGFFPSLTEQIGKLGEMHWNQQGFIDLASGQIEISELDMTLSDTAGTRFLELTSLRPFHIANEPFGFSVPGGSARVLKVTLTPLELQSLLPRILSLDVQGVLPKGEFYGRVDRQGRLILAAPDPLVFHGVTLSWEEALLVEDLSLGLSYEVAYSIMGLEARSFAIEAKDIQGDELATVSMKAVAPLTQRRPLQTLDLELNVALAALSRQPVLQGIHPLNAGTFSGQLSVDNISRSQLRGQFNLQGASAESLGRLPDLTATVSADAAPGEGLVVKLPIQMRSARGHSDLAFNGKVARLGERYRFEALLDGRKIIVPDLRQFHDLIIPSVQDGSGEDNIIRKRPSRTVLQQLRERRDDTPFWGPRLLGHAAVQLDKLQLQYHAVEDIRGEAQVLRDQVSLYGLHAQLLGGELRSDGSIKYHPKRPEPYDMNYRMHIQNLQVGDLLQPMNPDEPPTAEGLFTLNSNLSAQGLNPLDLSLNTQGRIDLSGRKGVFRGLAGRGDTASTAAKVAGTLTFSSQLRAIGRLLDDLDELHFSRLRLSLLRDSPQRLRLDEATLLSPLLHLEGSGNIAKQPGQALAQSPMEASVEIATRGDMSILFDGMGLLEESANSHGYRPMNRSLTVGGTLAEPDISELWNILDEAAGNARGSFGLGLKTINRQLNK